MAYAPKLRATWAPPFGLAVPGNLDLNARTVYNDPSGDYRTENSITIGTDQGEVLIPTVVGGRQLNEDEAIRHYEQTGEHLGIFKGPDDAERYAQTLHLRQEQHYAPARKSPMAGFGLGNYINPAVGGWIDQRRNALAGLGAGLLQGRPGAGVQEGIQADDAYATMQKAETERQANINQTKRWLQANYPQYANLPADQGWQAAMAAMAAKKTGSQALMNVGDGLIFDPNNRTWITPPTSGGAAPPYDGTSMDAQNWNIVLRGDPSSPEYAAAYSQLSQPKMTLQQTEQGMVPVWTSPQLPANIRPPTGMQAPSGTPNAAGQPGGGVSVGGALPGTQKAPTEQRARAKMMDSVISPEVTRLLGDGKTPGTFDALGNGWDVAKDGTGTAGRFVPFGVGTPSENFLKAKSAVRTIIASYLYVASGATANPGEVENQAAVLTPQVNDPPDVVKDKKARLQAMAEAVKALARGENVDLGALSVGGDVMSQADALLNSGKY